MIDKRSMDMVRLAMSNIFESETPTGRLDNKNTIFRTTKHYYQNTLTVFVDGVFRHDVINLDDMSFQLKTAPTSSSKIIVQYISLGE